MKFDLSIFRRQAADLGTHIRAVRADLERLRRERDDLKSAPANKEDVKAFVREHVARLEADFPAALRTMCSYMIGNPKIMADGEASRNFTMLGARKVRSNKPVLPEEMDVILAGFMAPVMLKACLSTIDAMDVQWGPSLAERERRLPEIETEIAQKSAELGELTRVIEQVDVDGPVAPVVGGLPPLESIGVRDDPKYPYGALDTSRRT